MTNDEEELLDENLIVNGLFGDDEPEENEDGELVADPFAPELEEEETI